MKINIPRELNQKKMWLSKPSHIEGLLLSPTTLSICLRDCFRPPKPHPRPTTAPALSSVPSFFSRPTEPLRRASSASTRPQTPAAVCLPDMLRSPAPGLPLACQPLVSSPPLALTVESNGSRAGTEAQRKRKRKGNRRKETWRLRRSKKKEEERAARGRLLSCGGSLRRTDLCITWQASHQATGLHHDKLAPFS